MTESIINVWKRKTEERLNETVEREFAGFPVKARRIPLRAMLRAGSLPQVLVEHMLRMDNDIEYRQQAISVKSPEHYNHNIHYQRQVIKDVIAEPRFVFEGEPGEGEVSYEHHVKLFPKFVDEVIEWVESGCPDVPVALTGGEKTTVEALAHFPDKRGGRKRAKPRTKGAGVKS
jgi:hypothetical protein